VGWVDADRAIGDLNVAIRTFWIEDDELNFGTGGGITWGSDPEAEWAETELKAANLLSVAAGSHPSDDRRGAAEQAAAGTAQEDPMEIEP
jgi:para-aminobenzoate synthetase component 1